MSDSKQVSVEEAKAWLRQMYRVARHTFPGIRPSYEYRTPDSENKLPEIESLITTQAARIAELEAENARLMGRAILEASESDAEFMARAEDTRSEGWRGCPFCEWFPCQRLSDDCYRYMQLQAQGFKLTPPTKENP